MEEIAINRAIHLNHKGSIDFSRSLNREFTVDIFPVVIHQSSPPDIGKGIAVKGKPRHHHINGLRASDAVGSPTVCSEQCTGLIVKILNQ